MMAFKTRKKRGSKFGNVKTTIDGIKFDSKAEAARYRELKAMQQAGLIYELECQPRYNFPLDGVPMRYVGGKRKGKVIEYVADFYYIQNDKLVIEDVKGVETAVFKLKRALMKEINGLDVVLIKGK